MAKTKSLALSRLWFWCAPFVLACESGSVDVAEQAWPLASANGAIQTLDEFAASSAVRGSPGQYLVEGDMLLSDDALALYYEERVLRRRSTGTIDKSIAATVYDSADNDTFDAVRPFAMDLRYCLSDGWGGAEALETTVEAALEDAGKVWAGVARVRFVHAADLDGAGCTQSIIGSVDFVVKPNVGKPNSAYGWWNYAQVSEVAVGTNMPYVAAMVHELGHVLGLDHEQYHDLSPLGCTQPTYDPPAGADHSWGDQRELTEYDNTSIMHYYDGSGNAVCSGGTPSTRRISRLDEIGLRSLYGNPDWWGAWIGS